jgi:hypothetical protein
LRFPTYGPLLLVRDDAGEIGRLSQDLVVTVIHGAIHSIPGEADGLACLPARPLRSRVLDLARGVHVLLVTFTWS